MNLINRYFSKRISNINIDKLQKMLSTDREANVVSATGGVIVLKNKGVIRCAANYFAPTELRDEKLLKSSKINKGVSKCHYVQRYLFYDTNVVIAPYNCVQCHLECLRLLKEKKIKISRHKRDVAYNTNKRRT